MKTRMGSHSPQPKSSITLVYKSRQRDHIRKPEGSGFVHGGNLPRPGFIASQPCNDVRTPGLLRSPAPRPASVWLWVRRRYQPEQRKFRLIQTVDGGGVRLPFAKHAPTMQTCVGFCSENVRRNSRQLLKSL